MKTKVLDFVKKREEAIEDRRRKFERIMFDNILGTYTVLNLDGTIYPVKLMDISHDGLMFEIPYDSKKGKKYEKNSEIMLRMYFSEKRFIPVAVKIRFSMEALEGPGQVYMRYGCEFDKSLTSFKALESFIDFLYKFSEVSTVDLTETKSFFF